MKEVKTGNSFNLKTEKFKLMSKLEKKEGKLERIEKRKKKLNSSNNKSLIRPKIRRAILGPVLIGLISFIAFNLNVDNTQNNFEFGVLIGIFLASLMWILSAFYLIFSDYINPRRLKKDRINLKLKIQGIESKIEEKTRDVKQKKLMDLILEGNIKFNEGNVINALQLFQNAQRVLVSGQKKFEEFDKNIPNLLYTKINLAQKQLNQKNIKKIEVLLLESNKQKEIGKLIASLQELQKAFKIANEMFPSDRKKHMEIKMIKTKFDEIYFLQINKLIEKGNQLKSQKTFNNSIETFKKALNISDNMYSSSQKDQLKEKIEQNLDLTYFDMINEKIESGNQLKRQLKFDDSIHNYQNALNNAKKIFNSLKKNSEIRKIKTLITQSKVAKIKNTILNLGVKFDRLHIAEIVEKCSESEGDIIDTALEMIKNKEIYAEYFKSTQSVVFDKQANNDEIDKLMEAYKEWEEKEVGKI